jgi:hypothetical protein
MITHLETILTKWRSPIKGSLHEFPLSDPAALEGRILLHAHMENAGLGNRSPRGWTIRPTVLAALESRQLETARLAERLSSPVPVAMGPYGAHAPGYPEPMGRLPG